MSSSGISWAICKSSPSSRQITMPPPHHSVFYRLDALPAAQPTVSKHWRPHTKGLICIKKNKIKLYSTTTKCTCPERHCALISLVFTEAMPVCADGGMICTSPLLTSGRLNDSGPMIITLSTATAGHMYSGILCNSQQILGKYLARNGLLQTLNKQ